MHEIIAWNGIELAIRSNSVDQENVDWLAQSPFWTSFETAQMNEDDLVLDLGAHIGAFAILAVRRCACRVFAFEPNVESATLCKINTLLNAVEDRVVCLQAAVAGRTGDTLLYEATENWGHTVLPNGGPYNVLTGSNVLVECLSLKDALIKVGGKRCAFLKFNIEGAEFDMIEQSDNATLRQISVMVGEIHSDLVPRGHHAMESRLRDAGFQIEIKPLENKRAILFARQAKV